MNCRTSNHLNNSFTRISFSTQLTTAPASYSNRNASPGHTHISG